MCVCVYVSVSVCECICVCVAEVDLAAIGGRDNSLFLFRALGKILYCKRELSAEGGREGGGEEGRGEEAGERGDGRRKEGGRLPTHLQCHERNKLLVDPEVFIMFM